MSLKRSKRDFLKLMANQFGNNPEMAQLQVDTLKHQGSLRDSLAMAPIRLLMEGRGLNIDNWFTDLAQPTYRVSNGLSDSQWTWIEGLAHQDSDIASIYGELMKFKDVRYQNGWAEPVPNSPLCQSLRSLSLRSTTALSVSALPLRPPSKYPNVFSKTCAQCHSDPRVQFAPHIPFDHPDQLKQRIEASDLGELIWQRVNAPEGEQMAPIKILSSQELSEVRRYLGK